MARLHPFFILGSIGMILTSLIHLLSTAVSDAINHAIFYVLYLIFGLMLFFGSGKTRRLERIRVRRK